MPAAPPKVQIGDTVLVRLDDEVYRPMTISACGPVVVSRLHAEDEVREFRVSGMIHCDPADHSARAIRSLDQKVFDPARIHGRPERLTPYVYGEYLKFGKGLGEWQLRTRPPVPVVSR